MRPGPAVLDRLAARLRKAREHPVSRRLLTLGHWALLAFIIGLLFYRLSQIGWRELAGSLPSSPWFYVFFLMRFLTLPVSETAVYEVVWSRPLAHHLPAFIRKRVYNSAVAGYAGEGFLTLWARRRLGLSGRDALFGVKDNNILSSLTANTATVLIVLALAVTGALPLALERLPGAPMLFALSFAVAAAMIVIVVFFGRKLIHLPEAKVRKVVAIHAARQALTLSFFAAMYAAALPGAGFAGILLFIALQLVISRVPFLPNQDLVYLAAALSFSSVVGAPAEAVAGMLVAEAGLSQLLSVALFFATAHLARRVGAPIPLNEPGAGRIEGL